MNRDGARIEHPLERSSDPMVVRRQQPIVGGEQLERQRLRLATLAVLFGEQSMVHRQGQFDAAGATADDGEPPDRASANPSEQRLPAAVEGVDRLDRNHQLRAFDVVESVAPIRC